MSSPVRTIFIHYADQRFKRSFMAELMCILISYTYSRVRGFDYYLDESGHPYLFTAGYANYFVPRWKEKPSLDDYDEIMGSCHKFRTNQIKNLKTTNIWEAFAYIQDHVHPSIRQFLTGNLLTVQPKVENAFLNCFERIGISKPYASIHIRRGDKVQSGQGDYIHAAEYLDKLSELNPNLKDLFICSDDYESVREVEDCNREKGLQMKIYTLVAPSETGYSMEENLSKKEVMSEQKIMDLLVDTLFCVNSENFVGTRSSNIWKVVSSWHPRPENCYAIGAAVRE